MKFNYDIVNKITSPYFEESFRGLYGECQTIENLYRDKYYAQCCVKVREVNESIIRELYFRIIGKKGNPTAGKILRDVDFCDKLKDPRMVVKSKNIQSIGNQYAHSTQFNDETLEQYEKRKKLLEEEALVKADEILENFSEALERTVDFINNRVNQEKNRQKSRNSSCGSLELVFEENTLIAYLNNVKDRKDYKYIWKIEGKKGILKAGGYKYLLNKKWLIGKTIILEAHSKNEEKLITTSYGPIKKEDINLEKETIQADAAPVSVGDTEIMNMTKPNGRIAIQKSENSESGRVRLEVKLKEADFDLNDDDVSIAWGFVKDNGNFHCVTSKKSTVFYASLSKGALGKIFKCEVARKGYSIPLKTEFRKLTENDFLNERENESSYVSVVSKEEGLKKDVQQSNQQDNAFDEKPFEEVPKEVPETIIGDIINESPGEKVSSGMDVKSTFDSDLTIFHSVEAPEFHCFDSNVSRLQYFVASRKDSYVTNSLKYLDYYAFLAELLKEQGYKRVILISHRSENKADNFPVIVYDKVSELSFIHPVEFNKFFVGSSDVDDASLERFCSEREKAENELTVNPNPIREKNDGKKSLKNMSVRKRSLFGRRVIQTISSTSGNDKNKITFGHFLNSYVVPALEQKIIKTAIVFPVELLSRKEHAASMLLNNIRDQIEKVSENILIISADPKTSLSKLFEISEYQNMEEEIFNANEALRESKEPVSHSNTIIDALSVSVDVLGTERKKVRILIANNRPGKDEIANLLILKKIREEEAYRKLPYSKIYALSEYLYNNCDCSEHTQKMFPLLKGDNTWDVNSIELLENCLRKKVVREALVGVSETLCARVVAKTDGWKSTCIERIYTRIGVVPLKRDRRIAYSGLPSIDRAIITKNERARMREKAFRELDALIGLEPVKKELKKVLSGISNPLAHSETQGPGSYIFWGNPGTGKTTVARLVGNILHSEGLLKRGHVVEVKKSDLVSEHIGGTQVKAMAKFEEALDGVLFLDEAYDLVNTDSNEEGSFKSSFDEEAYTLLLKFMEDNRDRVCVICAGYKDKMEKFLKANDGMRGRFTSIIDFPDYSGSELFDILKYMLEKKTKLRPDEDFMNASKNIMENMAEEARLGLEQFSNARNVRLYVEDSIKNATWRDPNTEVITKLDIPEKYKPLDLGTDEMQNMQRAAWNRLDVLIGLKEIKNKLRDVIEYSVRAAGKNRVPGHYAFVGNPGTGKTEVARLMADILHANGLLRTNKMVEVKASDIVGQYVGQSAPRALKKCEEALDGVLFIDEAYSMVNTGDSLGDNYSSSFARESYETIMKFMDDYRQRICVIFAGYRREMEIFLSANPGMRSRVKLENVIEFKNFTDDELIEIMEFMGEKSENFHHIFTDEFKNAVRRILSSMKKNKEFGNARDIRSLLEECQMSAVKRIPRAGRVVLDDGVEQLTFVVDDIPERYRAHSDDIDQFDQISNLYEDDRDASLPIYYLSKEKLASLPNSFDNLEAQEFRNHCKRATIRIVANGNYGTAFIITPDGYGVTCAHVVMGEHFSHLIRKGVAEYLSYTDEAQITVKISFDVMSVDTDCDLALIKFNVDFALPYLKIAPEDMVISDDTRGRLYGFPGGYSGIKFPEWTIASDEEDRTDRGKDSVRCLQVNAFPGDSGGPVVSDDGFVVGILQGAEKYGEGNLVVMKPVKHFWNKFIK